MDEGVPPEITVDELCASVRRTVKRTVTPGLDGIPGKVLAAASNFFQEDITGLLYECLKQGRFPDIWKNAELILIPKPGREDPASPSTYRPICLISEVGKTLGKISRTECGSIWNIRARTYLLISTGSGEATLRLMRTLG